MANRSLTTRFAHILERIGLAMAGASCGLFVSAHVARTGSEVVASPTAFFAMTFFGALGFYLGIDIPPHTALAGKVDAAELLSAIGTSIGTIDRQVAWPLTLDGEPGNEPQWRLWSLPSDACGRECLGASSSSKML
jgi:hypothetical protein